MDSFSPESQEMLVKPVELHRGEFFHYHCLFQWKNSFTKSWVDKIIVKIIMVIIKFVSCDGNDFQDVIHMSGGWRKRCIPP